MDKKCKVTVGMLGNKPGASFTNSFYLKDYKKGSVFTCRCGFTVGIPFSEKEVLSQATNEAAKAIEKGLKNLRF